MALQSTIGNAAVGNLVRASERATHERATPIDPYVQSRIARQAGGGELIAAPAAAPGVRVHHGPESDALTRMLGATGFTQGQDVFLRSDRHPASRAGRATLAHELTPVALGSVGPGAVMREPDIAEAVPMDSGSKASQAVVVAKIDEIPGTSEIPGHTGEHEFMSFTVGSSATLGSPGAHNDRDKAKEVHTSRRGDDSSPLFARALIEGTPLKTVRFAFLKPGDDGSLQEYRSIEFKEGLVSGYSVSGETESLEFNFKEGG